MVAKPSFFMGEVSLKATAGSGAAGTWDLKQLPYFLCCLLAVLCRSQLD